MRIQIRGLHSCAEVILLGLLLTACGEPNGGIVDNGVRPKDKDKEEVEPQADRSEVGEPDVAEFATVEVVLDNTYEVQLPLGFALDPASKSGEQTFRLDEKFVTFAVASEVVPSCSETAPAPNEFGVEVSACSTTLAYLTIPNVSVVSMRHNIGITQADIVTSTFRLPPK
ncbi:MAG: hypothetical protein AB7T49_19020 [Oligoflexales bacterium]